MTNPFDAPLERIRHCRYEDEDDGRKKWKVGKPASPKLRKVIGTQWITNGKVPRELEQFMDATSGIVGGATCDLRVGLELGTGPSGVWQLYDYGNGDCLGLEEDGDRCTVWWIGHDPWGVILVRDSLLAYITDVADFAEANDGAFASDEELWEPQHELLPKTGAEFPALQLPPEAVVYDFHGCPPRTHADLFKIPEHARRFEQQRLGRYLIAQPRVVPAVPPGVAEAATKVEHAIALAMMEQFAHAHALLDEALRLDPGHPRALEWKDQLKDKR